MSLFSTSNHKREIWDKFTEFTFEILKSLECNERYFKMSEIERGNFSPNFTNKHVISG